MQMLNIIPFILSLYYNNNIINVFLFDNFKQISFFFTLLNFQSSKYF